MPKSEVNDPINPARLPTTNPSLLVVDCVAVVAAVCWYEACAGGMVETAFGGKTALARAQHTPLEHLLGVAEAALVAGVN